MNYHARLPLLQRLWQHVFHACWGQNTACQNTACQNAA
jgi:hypothetical protein